MNENRIISVEEAENIMAGEVYESFKHLDPSFLYLQFVRLLKHYLFVFKVEGSGGVVKCGLPQSVRPSDPENKTDVETCISMLLQNDPSLTEINLNNMKVRKITRKHI